MESASTIFDAKGATFGYIYEEKREPVPLVGASPRTCNTPSFRRRTTGFYTHNGSDFRGILRASMKNLRSSRIRQGASTITQQLARNTFPLKGRTFSRKILEIYVARRIETTLTKDQIMEYYLNRIYLGSGLYGVEAASKGYFGKHAARPVAGRGGHARGIDQEPQQPLALARQSGRRRTRGTSCWAGWWTRTTSAGNNTRRRRTRNWPSSRAFSPAATATRWKPSASRSSRRSGWTARPARGSRFTRRSMPGSRRRRRKPSTTS